MKKYSNTKRRFAKPPKAVSLSSFEEVFLRQHALGERIFDCGDEIVRQLRKLVDDKPISDRLHAAMGFMVYLNNHFGDRTHLRAEEVAIELAVVRGLNPALGNWVFMQHEQARTYFRSMHVAWQRITGADELDSKIARGDFWRAVEGFVTLFRQHAVREDDELYLLLRKHLRGTDEEMTRKIISDFGPGDVTPYVEMVAEMERSLGLPVKSGA